ncbi:MobA/MobL family protein [Sporolactobacillus sp. CPB3-1]|uniref:MobA/MobL family protein n=1 Tax=Sporolactobacillus mangiferae TaxID=2940498 RepID=A0ABT0MDI2_9BACL|nr:MobQ family relaxase [Sporolactobacillus mangiferae]MCL1632925.1 MobA/MobL family protein [Sporolactobacillus mangiferae]
MAIYHCSIKIIKRSQGRSAVAAAAYRSGQRLTNEWDGITHDYTKKGGVVHSEILLPAHVPPEFSDRSILWNSVEKIEKSRNAQLAREIEVALPAEIDQQSQIRLVRKYVKDTFVASGMCVDFSIHDKGDGNPHAHIMLTLRPLSDCGEWGAKCGKEYDLDGRGQRIPLPSGGFKSHRVNTTDWNDPGKAEVWRAAWADACNRALEQIGRPERIDHRSYVRQGVQKISTVHMGVAATQMERRGLVTEKGTVNREIAAQNRLLKEIKARITRLYNWSKQQAAQPEQKPSIWEQLQQAQAATQPTTRYGKVKALKESAALFSFLQENGISSMQELYAKVTAMQTEYYTLRGEIAATARQIDELNKRLSMWKQYADNKPVRQQLAALKPRAWEKFQNAHSVELALYDASVRYLDELKVSGEKIAPKHWQAETERLTAQNISRYQQMKAMRTDIQAMEKIRKTADELARPERGRDRGRNHER